MKYHLIIKRVGQYSGLSDEESKDTLQLMVESLAIHLTEAERLDFASQLPTLLKNIALSVYVTAYNSKEDMLQQFVHFLRIDEDHAKRRMQAAWYALREAVSGGEIEDIKAQLPNKTVSLLQS